MATILYCYVGIYVCMRKNSCNVQFIMYKVLPNQICKLTQCMIHAFPKFIVGNKHGTQRMFYYSAKSTPILKVIVFVLLKYWNRKIPYQINELLQWSHNYHTYQTKGISIARKLPNELNMLSWGCISSCVISLTLIFT